jgi:Large polyvalent protein associated domain 38/DNA-dependent RNA polymerase
MAQGLGESVAAPTMAGLTMADDRAIRAAEYNQLRQGGMSPPDARAVIYGVQPTATTMAEDDGISRLGMVLPGLGTTIATGVRGAARMFGDDDASSVEDVADFFEPSDETQQAIQDRYTERARAQEAGEIGEFGRMTGDVLDSVASNVPQLALSLAGGVAGRAAVNPLTRNLPGMLAKPVTRAAETVGVAGISAPQLYESGVQTAIANGEDPTDPETRRLIALRTGLGTILESITPLSILGRMTGGRSSKIFEQSVMSAAARGAGTQAINEGVTEGIDVALEAMLLDPTFREKIAEGDIPAMIEYGMQRYGRDLATSFFTGGIIGGAAGIPTGITQATIQNAKDRQDVVRLSETLQATDVPAEAIGTLAKSPAGAAWVRAAAARLGKADMVRFAREKIISTPTPEQLASPGAVDRLRMSVKKQQVTAVRAQADYDAERDTVARQFGATVLPSDNAARDRLRSYGIQPDEKLDAKRARALAMDLDVSSRVVDSLKTMATASPDPVVQKAVAAEAVVAERDFRMARVRAAAEARGVPIAQIEAEAQVAEEQAAVAAEVAAQEQALSDAQQMSAALPEADEAGVGLGETPISAPVEQLVALRDQQEPGRQAAIERQMALEFPESMPMADRQARAQEIIEDFLADPDSDQKGLVAKIARLQRQRRAATTQEDIDKVNGEIVALEARRGLPTPAVEAARRVLQALSPVSTAPMDAKGQTAQLPPVAAAVVAGDTPLAAAADTDTGVRTSDVRRARVPGTKARSLMPSEPITGMDAVEAKLLEYTKTSGFEAAAFVKPDGTVIAMTSDDLVNGVHIPNEGRDDPDAIFTHTHTIQTPFSAADVVGMMGAMRNNIKRTVRAVLPDGEALEMKAEIYLNAEELGSIYSLTSDHIERTIRLSPADGPIAGSQLQIQRLRQEAMLQALASAGAITYTQRLKGLSAAEQELINAAIERAKSVLDPVRARGDDRGGAKTTGRKRRLAGEAGTGNESEIAARTRQRERPSANPAVVKQIAEQMSARILRPLGRGKPMHLRVALRDGLLTTSDLEAGIQVAAREIGNKESYAVFEVARALFPKANWADMPRVKVDDIRDGKKVGKVWEPSKDFQTYLSIALQLIGEVGHLGHGSFYGEENFVKNKAGRVFKTGFHLAAPKLERFLDKKSPPKARFMPALENPDDTTFVKRSARIADKDVKTDVEVVDDEDVDLDQEGDLEDAEVLQVSSSGNNLFSMAAMEPARRTARYLQANKYTIDEQALAKLVPKDMLSKKGLAQDGITMKHVDLYLKTADGYELQGKDELDIQKNHFRRIREKLRSAEEELKQLRASVEQYRAEFGDKPIGFVYRVDDKGRIYADGMFTPQSTDAVKGVFVADGVGLKDMSTVDASASGWQVAALMARDHVVADNVNLTPGRGKEKGAAKRDIYDDIIADITTQVERDASDPAAANHAAAKLIRDEVLAKGKLERLMIKTPVIATNYGADQGKFNFTFRKALGGIIRDATGQYTPIKGMWGYMGGIAYDSLKRRAPHTMEFQLWAIESISKLVKAVEGKKPGRDPSLTFSVGLDGDYQRRRNAKEQVAIRARANNHVNPKTDERGKAIFVKGEIVPMEKQREERQTTANIAYQSMNVDADATARSIYSQAIQAFDAAVLHRAVERYKQATKGAFITTNHDAFTVPKKFEGQIAAAVAESMAATLGQIDVPRRLYDEIMAQAKANEVDIDVKPFTGYGKYKVSEVSDASPVFVEDPISGKDVVPDFVDLPAEGSDLMKASDVNVARYMEQLPQVSGAVQKVVNAITDPWVTTRSLSEVLGDNLFNQFNPIARLEKQANKAAGKGAVLGLGMDSAFKFAEIAINDSGRNEALLHAGAASWGPNGEYSIANGTIGLYDIFRMAGGGGADRGQKLQDWMQWMVARRAEDLNKRGIKTPITPAEIAAALAKRTPDFTRAAAAWKAFNDANLDFLEKSGRINAAQKTAMQADAFYVPFYRADERVDGTSPELDLSDLKRGMGSANSGLLSRDPGIKKMMGGDKMAIQNLMVNMIRNSQAVVAAGMRNKAANKTMELMDVAGLAKFGPGSHAKPNPNAVRVWRNGVEGWMIPQTADAKPIVIAMAGFNSIQYTFFGRIANSLSSMFRQSVTLSLPFMIRNGIRGSVAAGLLTSGANMRWDSNTLTGFANAFNNGALTQAFKAQSGMGDYRFGGEDFGFGVGQSDMLMDFDLLGKGVNMKTAGYFVRKAMNQAERVGMATEYADRIAAYKTMIAEGVRPDEAAYQALTIMNYGRKGSSRAIKHILPMIPFLNARLQGLSRLAEGAVGPNATPETRSAALKRLGANGALLGAFSLALLGYTMSDDEDRDRYMAEPLHRRLSYYIIYAGDRTILIPKPFELGVAFSSIPELLSIETFGDQQAKDDNEVWRGLRKMFYDTVAFSAIPQFMVPMIEARSNYSFFRQAPIEAQREARLAPSDRIANSSPLATYLGRDMMISDITGLSPAKLTTLLEGYGGVVYSVMQTVFGFVAADMDLAPKTASPVFGNVPVASPIAQAAFGWMVKDQDFNSTRFSEDFYTLGRRAEQTYLSAKEAADQGNLDRFARLARSVPGLEQQYRLFTSARDDLGDLNSALRAIRNDRTLTREQKETAERPLRVRSAQLYAAATRAMRQIERNAGGG